MSEDAGAGLPQRGAHAPAAEHATAPYADAHSVEEPETHCVDAARAPERGADALGGTRSGTSDDDQRGQDGGSDSDGSDGSDSDGRGGDDDDDGGAAARRDAIIAGALRLHELEARLAARRRRVWVSANAVCVLTLAFAALCGYALGRHAARRHEAVGAARYALAECGNYYALRALLARVPPLATFGGPGAAEAACTPVDASTSAAALAETTRALAAHLCAPGAPRALAARHIGSPLCLALVRDGDDAGAGAAATPPPPPLVLLNPRRVAASLETRRSVEHDSLCRVDAPAHFLRPRLLSVRYDAAGAGPATGPATGPAALASYGGVERDFEDAAAADVAHVLDVLAALPVCA